MIHKNISVNDFRTDTNGRVLSVDININNKLIRVVNLYAPPQLTDRKHLFSFVPNYLIGGRELLIAGDFNCVLTQLDKNACLYPDGFRKIISDLISCYELRDAYRSKYPLYKGYTWEGKGIKERLDRIYLSKHIGKINNISINFLNNNSKKLSDHKLISLDINCYYKKSRYNKIKINYTILQDNTFQKDIKSILDKNKSDINWQNWQEIKNIITSIANNAWLRIKHNNFNKIKHLQKELSRKITDNNREAALAIENDISNEYENKIKDSYINYRMSKLGIERHTEKIVFKKKIKPNKSLTLNSIIVNGIHIPDDKRILEEFHKFDTNLYKHPSTNGPSGNK
ncbi:uncharacterized protein LOC111632265 [Centruroides sculpturatus]|uniref:uncharacterized protein LOC111632265 n=1 Tax=Centruroides sculpturatus TaxID=218467 RepID=UPI000C6C8CB3|nr:uncharacterized protein LOC111632265 [Centruroides sculpturatus]